MTSAAVKAAARAVSQNLLTEFNSYLLIGSLCRRDYSTEELCFPGDTVIVSVTQPIPPPHMWEGSAPPPGFKPINFRLEEEIYSFNIPDVTELLLGDASITAEIKCAAEYLSDRVELNLLGVINAFEYSLGDAQTGITGNVLDVADSIMFDGSGTDGTMYFVAGDIAPEVERLLRARPAIQVASLAPEHRTALTHCAVLRAEAMGLVTRRRRLGALAADAQSVYVETSDLGMTVVITPIPEQPKSVKVSIHLLFAAGALRSELGLRLFTAGSQTIAGNLEEVDAAVHGSPMAPAVPVAPSMESVRAALTSVLSDLLLERLHTTMDSLNESIPDPDSRLRIALRLLQRADGIQPASLINGCERQLHTLEMERGRFATAVEHHRHIEIDSREHILEQTAAAIAEEEAKLETLYSRHTQMETEIQTQRELIEWSVRDFDNAAGDAAAAIIALEGRLRQQTGSRPGVDQSTAARIS